MSLENEILQTENKLEDLKKRWPAHSVKPEMVLELERLEDEIKELKLKIVQNSCRRRSGQ